MKKILTLLITIIFYNPSFAQWEVLSNMPIPVKGAKAVVQDTVIYILGGYSDSVLTGTKIIQAYYPESDQWKVLKDSITVPRWGLSAVSYGDSVYIFGGSTTSNDSSYSIEGWGYQNTPNINWIDHNFNRSFAATSIVDEFLYIFGGSQDHSLYDSLSYLVRFNMIDHSLLDSFSINDSFAVELPSHQMAAMQNNRIFLFGGVYGTILRNISYLDLASHNWHELEIQLANPRSDGVALAHPNGSDIVLIGGKNEESEALKRVGAFNTDSYEIHEKRQLTYARSYHTAVVYKDSLIYVFGGRDAENKVVRAVERTDFLTLDAVTSNLEQSDVYSAKDFELLGNYPNPFNPQTDIAVKVNQPQYMTITIYDIQGRKIKTLVNDYMSRGEHKITWDARDNFGQNVTSGIYFYRISSGKETETNRMLLIK